jgi:parallel beta-helix repeat protein
MDNTAAGNVHEGVLVQGDANEIESNVVTGNGDPDGFPGILLDRVTSPPSSPDNNFVTGNFIAGNGDDGYRDEGTNNLGSNNYAVGNGYAGDPDGVGTGIDASAAASPVGSGNQSWGNDANDQCVPDPQCSAVSIWPEPKKPLPLASVNCDDRITASIRMNNDLTCNTIGLTVAPGVTLDMNGHTINGDGASVGLNLESGGDPVVVRNGTVRKFGVGVSTSGRASASTLVLVGNASSGWSSSKGASIKNSLALSNQAGIAVSGRFTIRDTLVAGNDFGVSLSEGSSGTFSKNLVHGNSGVGVGASAWGAEIRGNEAFGNSTGIMLFNLSKRNEISKNRIIGNEFSGYYDEGKSNSVTENVAIGNKAYGIQADVATSPKGSANRARGNEISDECIPAKFCKR